MTERRLPSSPGKLGRTPEEEFARGARPRVLAYGDELEPRERACVRRRVADGRARRDHLRRRAVVTRQTQQAAQDIGDVRPHHPPVGVKLVHHNELHISQKARPGGVVGQDAVVEHVGIGEDARRTLAHLAPFGGGRVAVVGGDEPFYAQSRREPPKLVQLVVRERLGWEEVERRAALPKRVKRRHLIAERLARGGRRRHHHVAAPFRSGEHLDLVAVGLHAQTR